jgi:hypothetical protein
VRPETLAAHVARVEAEIAEARRERLAQVIASALRCLAPDPKPSNPPHQETTR